MLCLWTRRKRLGLHQAYPVMQHDFIFRENIFPLCSLWCVCDHSSLHKRELKQNNGFYCFQLWDISQMGSTPGIITIFLSKTVKRGGAHGASSSANTFAAPSLLTHVQLRFNWGVLIRKEQTKYQRPSGRGWRGWGEQSKAEPWLVSRSWHAAQTSPILAETQCPKPSRNCRKFIKPEPKVSAPATNVHQAYAESKAVTPECTAYTKSQDTFLPAICSVLNHRAKPWLSETANSWDTVVPSFFSSIVTGWISSLKGTKASIALTLDSVTFSL